VKNKTNRTALIFAYYWPPASGPGVQRWLKFVKFLPEFGWDAIVVTPEHGSYPSTDPSLVQDVPSDTQVFKTNTLEPFRLFNILSGQANKGKATSVGMGDIKGSQSFIKKAGAYVRANFFVPDARKGWGRFAIKEGSKIIEQNDIDLIVTTGPPHSAHLIGLELHKKFGTPWVSDLRDPWTNIYYNKFLPRSKPTIKKDLKLETTVLETSSAVTTVSNGMKVEFEDRARKVRIIPNGYDEEDFPESYHPDKDSAFRLSYIGNLKVNQNCKELWEAISELADEIDGFQENFILSFTGNVHSEIIDTLKETGIDRMLENLAFVEHKEAVKRMIDADSLLFLIPDSPNNEQIITGKIFEYLASRTPLLSIGPSGGDAATILAGCERKPMIDYHQKGSIKEELRAQFLNWRESTEKIRISGNQHIKFSRRKLTEELVTLFDSIIP
jgi:glycosyltransferase involved in cell wall biosynthesis